MKQITRTKILRKVLILAFLIVSLVIVGSDKGISVSADTCMDAFTEYINANTDYDVARVLYFYNDPTSCAAVCATDQNYAQCLYNCGQTRATNLANAQIGLLSAAYDTCTPITVDECAQARAMADSCIYLYDFSIYSDPEEASAVAEQFSACRTASKVDSCQ